MAAIDPNSNLIQHCCKTRMQNQVIDRGAGGTRLVVEATRFVNDIRSLSSALDQVTDYIVLYNESRETITTSTTRDSHYYKQGKRATQAYAYKSIILHSEFLGHIRLMKIGTNTTL